jgi:hypothetical protein
MRQLIGKELREHFKVAVLGLVVFAVVLVLAYSRCTRLQERLGFGYGYGGDESMQPLLATDLLTQAAIFCGIFGALLGWLQIRAEKHPDLWAFLIHRPVGRNTILQSKLLSGLLLYAAGAGLPALGLVLVAATPGKVAAPFAWAMTLPLFAIFLVGIAFYLAGLLIGLRATRWYGSRLFGLGPPAFAAVALFGLPEFWQALLFIVFAQGLLGLAVWSSFRTGGHYTGQPVAGKFALLVTCTASAAVLLAMLVSGFMSVLWTDRMPTYSRYQLIKSGMVLKITQRGMDEGAIVDLNGNPVVDETTGQRMVLKDLTRHYGIVMSTRFNFSPDLGRVAEERGRYLDASRFFRPWSLVDKTIWYLTAEGRLVAYDAVTRRQIAVLAPPPDPGETEGRFLPPPAHTYRPLGTRETTMALPTARTTYLVDLEKPEMRPLLSVTNGDAILGLAQIASYLAPPGSNIVLVASRNSIRLVDFEGRLRFRLPFDPSPSEYSTISLHVFEGGAGYGLRFDPDHAINQKLGGRLLTHIKWMNPDGTVSRALDLPKLPEVEFETFADKCLIVLMPPVIPVLPSKVSERLVHVLRLLPALICAVLGWWLCRRNSFSLGPGIGWFVFHLLFGIPGFLAFLAVEEWPPKEHCSNCKRLRVMNRARCEHCAAPVQAPAKTGIEIFETLEAK